MKKVVDAIVSIAFLFLIAISFLKRSIAMPNTDIVDEIKFDLVADQVKETAPQINGVKGLSNLPKDSKVDSKSYCFCQERALANKIPKLQNSSDRIYVRPCVLACLFDGKKNPEECTKECRPVCKALTQGTQELKKALKLKKGCKEHKDCLEHFCSWPTADPYCSTTTGKCECDDCCGRPFIIDGRYRSATSIVGKIDASNAKTRWNIDQVPNTLTNNSVNQAIAMEFLNQGEGEHASVASFGRHTLQLMSMGAPPALLMGSQQAGVDEINHAKMCYGIAQAFLGTSIHPSSLDIDGSVRALGKKDVLQSVIFEGCIGETISAVKAQLGAHNAKEPIIRDILVTIAEDESNHAQLAWNTVKWAINRFPSLSNTANETFKTRLDRPKKTLENLPSEYCYDCERDSALRDHGLLLDIDEFNCENLGLRNLIEPAVHNEFKKVEAISTQILNIDFSKHQQN